MNMPVQIIRYNPLSLLIRKAETAPPVVPARSSDFSSGVGDKSFFFDQLQHNLSLSSLKKRRRNQALISSCSAGVAHSADHTYPILFSETDFTNQWFSIIFCGGHTSIAALSLHFSNALSAARNFLPQILNVLSPTADLLPQLFARFPREGICHRALSKYFSRQGLYRRKLLNASPDRSFNNSDVKHISFDRRFNKLKLKHSFPDWGFNNLKANHIGFGCGYHFITIKIVGFDYGFDIHYINNFSLAKVLTNQLVKI
jgi:hypothetical protein